LEIGKTARCYVLDEGKLLISLEELETMDMNLKSEREVGDNMGY